jgi:hypothetical protein
MTDTKCIRCGGGLVDAGIYCPRCRAIEDAKAAPHEVDPQKYVPILRGIVKDQNDMSALGFFCQIYDAVGAGRVQPEAVYWLAVDLITMITQHSGPSLGRFVNDVMRNYKDETRYKALLAIMEKAGVQFLADEGDSEDDADDSEEYGRKQGA